MFNILLLMCSCLQLAFCASCNDCFSLYLSSAVMSVNQVNIMIDSKECQHKVHMIGSERSVEMMLLDWCLICLRMEDRSGIKFIDDKKSLSSYERACRAHILFMINILPDRFSILYRLGFGKSWARSIYYDSEKKNHYEKTNGLQDVLYSTLGFRLLILSKIFSEISIGFDLKRGEISNTIKIDIKTKKEKNQILLDVDSVGKKFIYGVSEWCSKIFLDASIFINLSKIVGIHCIGRISLHDNNSLNNMSSRLYDILIGINLTTD